VIHHVCFYNSVQIACLSLELFHPYPITTIGPKYCFMIISRNSQRQWMIMIFSSAGAIARGFFSRSINCKIINAAAGGAIAGSRIYTLNFICSAP
jgi:hypothetical protein